MEVVAFSQPTGTFHIWEAQGVFRRYLGKSSGMDELYNALPMSLGG